jgi:F-type H+-transporting ATPase subunit b
MEETLQALGGILLKAIPTVILLLILHFYLKVVLFQPIQKVLKQREELTEGARRAAERSLANAEQKAAEYEERLREARAEVYKAHEEQRRKWLEEQAAHVVQARDGAGTTVRKAKEAIQAESSAARQTLERTSESLADQIADSLLARSSG